ncbi:MAG: hypothetical protein H7Y04_09920 [Verrucomicrobia bacterium]|nr:hypothetical protein [Cytophagales bacterium]
MKNLTLISIIILTFSLSSFGQHLGLTFQEAERKGISITNLDTLYKSSLHTDITKAVFKTQKEQESLQQAYIKLLKDFGKFLHVNNFRWKKQTKCFNRIYFSADGSIDYFLFNFLGKNEEKPSVDKQKEFQRLLNVFIKNYKFSLTAKVKFAQCSPTTYTP